MSEAFSQELTYDLSKDGSALTVYVKGARLEVSKEGNEGIDYRVLSGFQTQSYSVVPPYPGRLGALEDRLGVSSSGPEVRPLARRVEVTDDELRVDLADARRLSVPLVWFPRLVAATPEARGRLELLGDGERIHWPDADEDLSVAGLLVGAPGAGLRPRAA